MTLPAYPGRDTPKSYQGSHVPAECSDCGHRAYIPPKSFGDDSGYCTGCESIVAWEYWREEPA